jgi:guanylate kinase
MSSEATARRGQLFVVSAPSAAGKTTLIRRLFEGLWHDGERPEFAVSHTTRRPRPDEKAGVHYHYVDDATFDGMVVGEEFLEWAEVHGRRYGTSRSEVDGRLARGVDVVLDLDVQGAESVLATHPDACSVLVLPPSYEELYRRIAGRGHESAEEIARRLSVSLWEIERYSIYDYVIINDEVERACSELKAVLTARRCSREHNETRIQAILADFRSALGPRAHHTRQHPSPLEINDGSDSREN